MRAAQRTDAAAAIELNALRPLDQVRPAILLAAFPSCALHRHLSFQFHFKRNTMYLSVRRIYLSPRHSHLDSRSVVVVVVSSVQAVSFRINALPLSRIIFLPHHYLLFLSLSLPLSTFAALLLRGLDLRETNLCISMAARRLLIGEQKKSIEYRPFRHLSYSVFFSPLKVVVYSNVTDEEPSSHFIFRHNFRPNGSQRME